ncbi:acyltransferase [Inquilinus sp. KBS0705]|nr:acyltransferase [Inquilinus sp. KBS0705]
MKTITQLDVGRHNNFDVLRLMAALMVILSHAYLITGNFASEPYVKVLGFTDMGAFGVGIFFIISGYLVLKSLCRQKTPGSFVKARALRIFPGLIASALFCAFVIGPLCTNLPLSAYFKSPETYDFLWRFSALHNIKNMLPGVFVSNPYPRHVNSPVWTLPAEILLYLGVFVIGLVRLVWQKQYKLLLQALPLILLLAAFFFKKNYSLEYYNYTVCSWGIYFLTGMLFYWFNKHIKISIRVFLVLLAAFLVLYFLNIPLYSYVFMAVLVYGVFVFAYHPKLHISLAKNWGDFSYGRYIYTFPVQQMLIAKFGILGPINNFLLSVLLTLPLAMLSWYYMEKPILALKQGSKKLQPIIL